MNSRFLFATLLLLGTLINSRADDAAQKIQADRAKSKDNLKKIGLAMHEYHDLHGMLPPAAICDTHGKPMLSWRVLLLPHIKEGKLYEQFRLGEPWDSEHNIKLIGKMPTIYALPGATDKSEQPSTYYQVFVGNHAMFDHSHGTPFARITDGLYMTAMAVEAEKAVPWSKPEDIVYDPKKRPPIGYHYDERCNILFGNSVVRGWKKDRAEAVLHLYIQRDDGTPVVIYDD